MQMGTYQDQTKDAGGTALARTSVRLNAKRSAFSPLDSNLQGGFPAEEAGGERTIRPTKKARNKNRVPSTVYQKPQQASIPVDGEEVSAPVAATEPLRGQTELRADAAKPTAAQADGSVEDEEVPADRSGKAGDGGGDGFEGRQSERGSEMQQGKSHDQEHAGQGGSGAGVDWCTYSRCKMANGSDGKEPDESRRSGAGKVCMVCEAALHNLCCQEITQQVGVFLCEKCPLPPGGRVNGNAHLQPGSANEAGCAAPGAAEPAPELPATSEDAPILARQPRRSTGQRPPHCQRRDQPKGAQAFEGAAASGDPGRRGKNGGTLGAVGCPKCGVLQESGRKYCREETCRAPIREVRAAQKRAAEVETMRTAEACTNFNLGTASKSLFESTRKRIHLASGGSAEAIMMLAHKGKNGEKTFKFFGVGRASEMYAKNSIIQTAYRTHMLKWYTQEEERREQAARAKVPLTPDDLEVKRFLTSLGSEFVTYADRFHKEQLTMEALRLVKDENLVELGMPMGHRIRLLAGIVGYVRASKETEAVPAQSAHTITEPIEPVDEAADSESSAGVL